MQPSIFHFLAPWTRKGDEAWPRWRKKQLRNQTQGLACDRRLRFDLPLRSAFQRELPSIWVGSSSLDPLHWSIPPCLLLGPPAKHCHFPARMHDDIALSSGDGVLTSLMYFLPFNNGASGDKMNILLSLTPLSY